MEITIMEVLDIEFKSNEMDRKVTIRQWFKQLLLTLWEEGESFNGKRPFGNSGWQWEIYEVLIKNKIIPGKLDADGFIEEFDQEKANKFVMGLIKQL